MSNTIFNNHPLIKNTNQYFLEEKYVSIHSEDRDITKYPKSSEFEITLPQELLNVASAKLYSWSFPANYDVFSLSNYNIIMTYKFLNLYNPGEFSVSDPLLEGIFAALYYHGDKEIVVEIEAGFYNPDQMSTELTNKFNESATRVIRNFLDDPANLPQYETAKNLFISYNRFKIAYNSVSQKLWFGNNADKFVLTNESGEYFKQFLVDSNCLRRQQLPEWTNWGLPFYLGFTKCNATALSVDEYLNAFPDRGPVYVAIQNDPPLPRFFYGSASSDGQMDDGFWLIPDLPKATVYFLQAPFKISFMGPAYIYMEIAGMNCIDETSPYNLSLYTATNTTTNSIVNSSFAKIAVPTTPISHWFDDNMAPYKYWNPPAERISKLKIKFRYHNGTLVEFGQFEYSFMLQFNILRPQQEKSYSVVSAFDLSQQQSYASKFV